MNARRRIAAALFVVLQAPPAAAEPPVEYQVQAAYVSKFLRFVEWPAGLGAADGFRVGVVGGPEFREAMGALDGYLVDAVPVAVEHVASADALDGLDVLVVGPPRSREQVARYLRAAAGFAILTVGDAPHFLEDGGIIQFFLVEETMRFAIDGEAAERAGLRVSSRLLRLARPLPR